LASASGAIAQQFNPTALGIKPIIIRRLTLCKNISQEMTKISKSVQNFNNVIKEMLEN
jgi:hypothetical protein